MIHRDPVEPHDGRVAQFKAMVEDVIKKKDERLSIHDFRIVDGKERINLIFDLVAPREYKGSEVGRLKTEISEEVNRRDKRCFCVITVENSFISEARHEK